MSTTISQFLRTFLLILSTIISLIDCQCQLYTIQSGDTFFALAQQNGISVNDMINANPGVDFTRLQVGQIVCIPLRGIITTPPFTITTPPFTITTRPFTITTPPFTITTRPFTITTPPFNTQPTNNPNLRCDYTYVVKSGEQCASIAQLFPSFSSLNFGINCAFLQAGQRVCTGNNNGFTYNQCTMTTTVRPGDTCQTIGTRTGSTMEYLYNCNPSINLACNNLSSGQTLKI